VDKAIRIEQAIVKQRLGDLDYFHRQLERYMAAQHESQARPPGP